MYTVENTQNPRAKKLFFDKVDYKKLKTALKKLGYEIETPEMIQKNAEQYGLIAPSTAQLNECKNRITFRKDIDDYRIFIKTTFNPETMETTKYGAGSVGIKRISDDKMLYYSVFNRNEIFIESLTLHAGFWDFELKTRPIDQDNRPCLMELHQTRAGNTYWMGSDKKNKIQVFAESRIFEPYREGILKFRKEREAFEKSRKARGINSRRRDSKKLHKKKYTIKKFK